MVSFPLFKGLSLDWQQAAWCRLVSRHTERTDHEFSTAAGNQFMLPLMRISTEIVMDSVAHKHMILEYIQAAASTVQCTHLIWSSTGIRARIDLHCKEFLQVYSIFLNFFVQRAALAVIGISLQHRFFVVRLHGSSSATGSKRALGRTHADQDMHFDCVGRAEFVGQLSSTPAGTCSSFIDADSASVGNNQRSVRIASLCLLQCTADIG